MKIILPENLRRVKRAIPIIENNIKVKFNFRGRSVSIKGGELNEYLAEQILRAVDFGFNVNDALLLKDENYLIEYIDITKNTPRKNLKEVRARLIGRKGKVKKTIENISGAVIVVKGKTVGVIVDSDHLNMVVQGIESICHGAKQGNIFSYLEKQKSRMKTYGGDLGLNV